MFVGILVCEMARRDPQSILSIKICPNTSSGVYSHITNKDQSVDGRNVAPHSGLICGVFLRFFYSFPSGTVTLAKIRNYFFISILK
jgi:hypothetical protein